MSEKSLAKNYRIIGKGDGLERLLIKGKLYWNESKLNYMWSIGKKEGQVDEIDGDSYKYYLLAGTTRPYPDDTFYSVGRVPRNCCTIYYLFHWSIYSVFITNSNMKISVKNPIQINGTDNFLRKLLMKYLGVKMYLVRLKEPPIKVFLYYITFLKKIRNFSLLKTTDEEWMNMDSFEDSLLFAFKGRLWFSILIFYDNIFDCDSNKFCQQ